MTLPLSYSRTVSLVRLLSASRFALRRTVASCPNARQPLSAARRNSDVRALPVAFVHMLAGLPAVARASERRLERETGIEPATNSLEGCDSTTELLPPTRSLTSLLRATAGKPAVAPPSVSSNRHQPDATATKAGLPTVARGLGTQPRAKVGGEGSTRTFEAARATDL